MSLEICKNCERTIGNFEQAYIYNSKIVCEQCNSMLIVAPEPAIDNILAPARNEVVIWVRWPGKWFIIDCKFKVTFDGKLIEKVSIKNPYFKEIQTNIGIHTIDVKLLIRGAKRYTLNCPYPGYYLVILNYSETWGNFEKSCGFLYNPSTEFMSQYEQYEISAKKDLKELFCGKLYKIKHLI